MDESLPVLHTNCLYCQIIASWLYFKVQVRLNKQETVYISSCTACNIELLGESHYFPVLYQGP